VRARGLAEATAMAKRAEAFRAYNEAAVAQMIIDKLPEMAQAVSAPLSRVDKIVMVNTGGDGIGASKLTQEVTGIMTQVPPVIEAMTGLKLSDLVSRLPGMPGAAASNEETSREAPETETMSPAPATADVPSANPS